MALCNSGVKMRARKMSSSDFDILLTKYNGKEANVVIPDGVTTIGAYAFSDCTTVKEVTIPDQVKSIEYTAFWDCDNLECMKIGKGLENPSQYGLIGDCGKFKGFEVDEANPYLKAVDGDLYTKNGDFLYYAIGKQAETFTLPSGTKKIGPFAFFGCDNLHSVIIPEGVEEIGERAFDCSKVAEVVVPSTVKEIGESAMSGENLVVKAPKGSYAIKWAKKNKVRFEII